MLKEINGPMSNGDSHLDGAKVASSHFHVWKSQQIHRNVDSPISPENPAIARTDPLWKTVVRLVAKSRYQREDRCEYRGNVFQQNLETGISGERRAIGALK